METKTNEYKKISGSMVALENYHTENRCSELPARLLQLAESLPITVPGQRESSVGVK